MTTVEFITSNEGKVREVAAKLAPLGYEVVQKRYDYPEVQADTLEAVARFGIDHILAHNEITEPILIDDSGLFVEALNGFPGVYSAFVLKTVSYHGVLKLMDGEENRKAYFETSIAFKAPGKDVVFAGGRCDGVISNEPMEGPGGFGFDPIFIPYLEDGSLAEGSFSQLPLDLKNTISHRGRAIAELVEKLASGQ